MAVIQRLGHLLLVTSLVIVGSQSVQGEHLADEMKERPARSGKVVRTDLYGDPLPERAIARLGTIRLRHGGDIFSVIFTPDGKSVIASDPGVICIYDPTTGARVRSFPGHRDGMEVLALSQDGKMLAGIGGANSVYLWDLATGRFLREFGKRDEGEVSNLI